jgi:AcrR family transcriptional regulator
MSGAHAERRTPDELPSPLQTPDVVVKQAIVRGRNPKFRRRKGARPEELIAAALKLFGERGFAKTNVKDVAREAGVSKGTVYLYFKNKEELLLAAVQRSVIPILDFGDEYEIDSDESASDILRWLVHKWVDEFEKRNVAVLPRLVVAESTNFPELAEFFVNTVLQRARRLFRRVLKRGIRTGEFRDMDVKMTVQVFLAPVIWLQIHKASLGPHDPDFGDVRTYLDTHVELFLAAVQKRP